MATTRTAALFLAGALAAASELGRPDPERARTFDLRHVRAELSFDLSSREVLGVARLSIAPLKLGEPVRLDAAGLLISSVQAAGRMIDFKSSEGALVFDAPHQGPFDVTIHYRARPRRGVYFLREGGRVRQIYSQGFPDDNHHWLPIYDAPNDKTTSEILLTVPREWTTVSNGALIRISGDGDTRTWHWRLDRPQPTYLISFVAGEMDCAEDGGLEYCAPAGDGARARLAFGRTRDAMRFFESKLGPFPWPRYSQIVLRDAIYSGMENTGAVTYSPDVLLPGRQRANDATIAHELAHQWFGDSVTFSDFRHLWLSEGFATGLANLWVENYYGPADAASDRAAAREAILSSPAMQRYPIVRKAGVTTDPANLLAYEKGGWILHMLRRRLGDDEFWRALRQWYASKAYQNVTTSEAKRAFGERGALIFEQYVERPGHPDFAVRWRWRGGKVLVDVEQKAALFTLPITLDLAGDRHSINVTHRRQQFVFDRASKPAWVRFDPDGDWLAAVSVTPAPPASPVLKSDPVPPPPGTPVRRRIAALQSGKASPEEIRTAAIDENHRVRMAAASAMAVRRDRAALRRLIDDDELDLVSDHARRLLSSLSRHSRR